MNDDHKPYYGRDRRYSKERRAARPADHRRTQSLLPHPSIIERYEELSPGAGARIMDMAEEELAHRHQWEDHYCEEYMRLYRRGQVFGLVVSLIVTGASFYLFLNQQVTGALVIAAGGFGSLMTASVVAGVKKRFRRKRGFRG